jgi:hypothetical protein
MSEKLSLTPRDVLTAFLVDLLVIVVVGGDGLMLLQRVFFVFVVNKHDIKQEGTIG